MMINPLVAGGVLTIDNPKDPSDPIGFQQLKKISGLLTIISV